MTSGIKKCPPSVYQTEAGAKRTRLTGRELCYIIIAGPSQKGKGPMLHNDAVWHEKYRRWQVNVTINGKRKSFYSSTPGRAGKKEAEQKAARWSDASATKDTKVSQAWKEYLEHVKRTSGTSNYAKAESAGRLYITPSIGNRRLSSIKTKDWQAIIDKQSERGLAHKTLSNIRGYMRTFVGWSQENEYIVIMGNVNIPRSAKRTKRRVARPHDICRVFANDTVVKRHKTGPEWFVHAYRFIIINGLRRGECAGIHEEDIEDGVLTLRRSINSFEEITEGKNENAQRRIGLSNIAITIVEQQRRMKREAGIISPWLFCDQEGERMRSNALYKEWHEYYAKQLGIECSLHELRHTFISAVKSDMPLALLKGQVGHSVDTDSIGTYGHEYDDDLQRCANIVDRVFNNITRRSVTQN